MIKNMLPKSPLAAAGLGLLLGAGIGAFKGWQDVKKGDATQKEAVATAVKQGLIFGGVAAASTLAGGNKGGGAGLATMAVVGLGGGGGSALPAMLSSLSGGGGGGGGGRGGMGGGGGGGQGQRGGGQSSSSALDTVSNAVSEFLVSAISKKKEKPNSNESIPAHTSDAVDSTGDTTDVDVEPSLTPSVAT